MKTSKRILSSVMAFIMVFSIFTVGFTANAVEANSARLDEIVLEPITRPVVDFYCTPVTRVAKAANSMEPGNQIVKATPSGVPELSGAYAQQAYAGETPEASRVYLATKTAGITPDNVTITCDNESVTLSAMKVDTASGAYCCDITGGTAEPGTLITFTVDYVWTDGNAYQEKCVSYVENISTGGSYAYAELVYKPYFGMSSWYIGSASASTRILGKGVYYEQPAGFEGSTDPLSTYGTYDPSTGSYIENNAGGYNTHIYNSSASHQENMAPRVETANNAFVTGTPIAHVYIDTSATKTLSDINLRIDGNVANLSDRNNDNPHTALDSVWVMSGTDVNADNLVNDDAAQGILGITIPGKKDNGVKEKLSGDNGEQARQTVTGAASQYNKLYTYGLTGSVSNITDGASYTIVNKYYSFFRPSSAYVTASATVPTSIMFHLVDKGALAELLEYVMSSDPTVPTTRDKNKGANPQAWYYKSGFANFQTAYTAALGVYNNPKATQAEVDAAAKSLQTMYNGLTLKNADYTKVNELSAVAEEILDNAEYYNEADIALVELALDGVTKNYSILYQGAVDTMAKNLQTAIDGAKIRGADYSEVNALVEEANALRETDYTPASWQNLQTVVNAVDYGKAYIDQADVDAMAQAIRNALDNLVAVVADFRALKDKVAEAKAIDLSVYANPEVLDQPLANAEAAIASHASAAWNESRQSEVDALTTALDSAIKSLKIKSADKTALKKAIDAEIPGNLANYDQTILAEYQALVAEGTAMYNDDTIGVKDQSIVNIKTNEITTKYAQLMSTYDDTCKHVLGEEVKENVKNASCTRGGSYDSVYYCTKCGEEVSRTMVTVPATGHIEGEPVIKNQVAATCSKEGKYDTYTYCTVCGATVSRVTTKIPMTEHTQAEAVIENEFAADCIYNGGYETVVYCVDCGEELSRVETVIPATGHTKGEAVKENNVAATCTEAGGFDTVTYCTVCGEEISRKTTTLPAKGHKEKAAVKENEVAATPTTNGSYDMVVYCSVCGEELKRDSFVIEALGHTSGAEVIEKEVSATCTETGSYDKVVYCTCCATAVELSRETVVVDALGHNEADAVKENEVAATCTEAGSYDMVVYCSVCGEEISRDANVIEALGHVEAEAVEENRVEATYDAAGSYDMVVYCTVCGAEINRETFEIPMLDGYFKAAEGSTTVIDENLGYIYGLEIGLADLEGYVEYSKSVSYETPDGIGTGMTLTTFRGGNEWETYTIVIFGDLNGDGVIDIYDSSVLAAIVNGDMELEEGDVILFAADLNGDTAVDVYDLAILNSVVNGETEIAQIPMV